MSERNGYSQTLGSQTFMKRFRTLLTLASLWLLLVGLVQAGTPHYYYTDPQGTPLVKADASGNVLARYDYAPYGMSVASLGNPPNGPGYTGHVNDPETGLVYMQARYYDPALGRFLSIDPVKPSAGNGFNFNRYAYAANNPVVHTDPDGRQYDEPGVELENRMNDPAVAAGELQASQRAVPIAAGFVPVVGDAQNVADAVDNPSALNVAIAVIGIVPELGEPARLLKGMAGGERAGKAFTRAGKAEVKAENAAAHDGKMICEACGKEVVPAQQSRAGVKPPDNEAHVDHIVAKSKGGDGSPANGQILCRTCNLDKGAH